ncbi:MAG TPA: hypothetical protein VF559_10660 [Caulobacteraceae bacterium]|jgi:pyocin large subunit-like protein
MRHPFLGAAIALIIGVIGLAGCNQQASKPARSENASPATSAASDASATVTDTTRGDRAGRRGGRMNADGPLRSDGKPMWAGNRKRPAAENAQKMYERNGKDFGAASVDDYVNKVHAFVANPPSGVKTATRANGDKLYYDAASNTFAVVNRRGAPKIMMKPRKGAEYWQQQLANLDKRGGRGNRQARRGGDSGGADDDAG